MNVSMNCPEYELSMKLCRSDFTRGENVSVSLILSLVD
jgi:hypothetical protein